MLKRGRMKKTTQPSIASLAQVSKPAGQLLSRDGQAVARKLEFYREAEERLFANRNSYRRGRSYLSSWPTER